MSAAKWCAWCGDDLHTTDARRRYCNPRCAGKYERAVHHDKLMARFDAGEELTPAQFSIIAHAVAPQRFRANR
jgi:hypothetical protein